MQVSHLQSMNLSSRDENDFFDFYEAAIQCRARERMLSVGGAIGRRSLRYVTDASHDDSVYSLVCMVCVKIKTHVGLCSRRVGGVRVKLCDIQYRSGADLLKWLGNDHDHFNKTFGFGTFMQRYGQAWQERGQWGGDLREFGPTRWEWCRLLKSRGMSEPFEIWCCPEDVKCVEKHRPEVIHTDCDVPISTDCFRYLQSGKDVPMALANENMWGYVASIVTQYQVQWIEMAAVLPYGTCIIVCYVEGDRGHLMNEIHKENQHSTAVHGHALSFTMPWEDLVKSLRQRVKSIPRDPQCLKYMLRLHLKVAG